MSAAMEELEVRPLEEGDLEEVLELEGECFPHPWSRGMLEEEVGRPNGVFLVARGGGLLLGYAGIIFIVDEGHVTNLAVRREYRRRGIATLLLLGLISHALAAGVRFLTLEVRRSNLPAISFYERLGFRVVGERRRYYADNGEDALIMWTGDIGTEGYREYFNYISGRAAPPLEGGSR